MARPGALDRGFAPRLQAGGLSSTSEEEEGADKEVAKEHEEEDYTVLKAKGAL